MYHQPVLAKESIAALNIEADSTIVDATFGGGGHSKLILEQLGSTGRLFGFDQDADAAQNAIDDSRFTFVQANFEHLARFLKLYTVRSVDGILADLGVSSHQLDEGERGFSYRYEADLDMRMNQQNERTAATILNTYTQDTLQDIFSRYGEVRNAKTLAQAIVAARSQQSFKTINDLMLTIEPLIKGQRLRYLSQVFQALRIEVNDEMGVLERFLKNAMKVLKPGGKLVIIAYHSLEDRMVKQFLKTGNINGDIQRDFYGEIFRPFKIITKKAVLPSNEEIKMNSRARSAKMRVGERLEISE
ncbi:MAG: 16S rRNA (cytosine(1402)-N(4))-methyltransferase RsmH, partial [Bacteroidota bacterium]